MKNNNVKILMRTMAAVILAAALMATPAYCESDGIALLVQQSPVEGGTVTPEMGVHRFGPGMEVVITAVPQQGYQFVYWIGDVGDAASSRTTIYLDSPKIVIAVFERSEYDFLVTDVLPQGQGGGGLIRSPGDYSNQGFSGGGAAGRRSIGGQSEPIPDTPDDFPTPPPGNEVNDFPVPEPIPEPATISLIIMGSLGIVGKRRERTRKLM